MVYITYPVKCITVQMSVWRMPTNWTNAAAPVVTYSVDGEYTADGSCGTLSGSV